MVRLSLVYTLMMAPGMLSWHQEIHSLARKLPVERYMLQSALGKLKKLKPRMGLCMFRKPRTQETDNELLSFLELLHQRRNLMTTLEELNLEVKVLKAEIKNVIVEIHEMKESQKELNRFMYELKGGKKWMVSLILLSSALGGLVTHIFSIFTLKV